MLGSDKKEEKQVKEDYSFEIERKLEGVPKGRLWMKKRYSNQNDGVLLVKALHSCSDGKGMIEVYTVFPGVELSFHHYHAKKFHFQHAAMQSAVQLNHCRYGRLGWNLEGGNRSWHLSVMVLMTIRCRLQRQSAFPGNV